MDVGCHAFAARRTELIPFCFSWPRKHAKPGIDTSHFAVELSVIPSRMATALSYPPQHIQRCCRQDGRSGGQQFVGRSESPQRADGEHPCRDGRLHVGVRVAQIQDFARCDAQSGGDRQRPSGWGLYGSPATAP